jgi:hypothetical protein
MQHEFAATHHGHAMTNCLMLTSAAEDFAYLKLCFVFFARLAQARGFDHPFFAQNATSQGERSTAVPAILGVGAVANQIVLLIA